MKLPFRILVVDDDENALGGMVEILRDAGYEVAGVTTYDAAKRHLAVDAYDLLITDVRLRGFNGLNLVRACRTENRETGVIIVSGYDEPLMELEASRYQATFVQKPIRVASFLETVSAALGRVRRQRRWPRKRVQGGFRVTAAGCPAAVVDVGYGGLRLEVPRDTELPSPFQVELSGIGLQLQAHPVWSCPSDNANYTMYGAALDADHAPAVDTWRAIVDRLSA